MPFIREYPAVPEISAAPCIFLRNKAMYLRGTVGEPENYPEETNAPQCWCEQTQYYLGPDNQETGRHQCVPGRECYRETY